MIGVCMRWLGGRIHPPRDEIVKRGSLTRVVIDPKYWHAPCILRAATEPCGFIFIRNTYIGNKGLFVSKPWGPFWGYPRKAMSFANTISNPAFAKPKESPPQPAKSAATFIFLIDAPTHYSYNFLIY